MKQRNSIPIYIHGLPGSHQEIERISDVKVINISPFGLQGFEKLLKPNETYKVIGFSLGCMTAIEISARYPNQVEELVLISPAAPLELGDFLNNMDGRYVFKVAQSSRSLFWLLALSQNIMARFTPYFLMHKMFGESCDAERELLKDPEFVRIFQNGLKQSLVHESAQYRQAILRYIKPWHEHLPKVKCPVRIWHGRKDTWVPFEMGKALDKAFKDQSDLIACDGLGHYSTLYKALPIVLEQPSSG